MDKKRARDAELIVLLALIAQHDRPTYRKLRAEAWQYAKPRKIEETN